MQIILFAAFVCMGVTDASHYAAGAYGGDAYGAPALPPFGAAARHPLYARAYDHHAYAGHPANDYVTARRSFHSFNDRISL